MALDIQDIINSVSVPSLILDDFVRRGSFSKLRNGDIQAYVGGFSVVFPVTVNGEKWGFRCWHTPIDDAYERYKLIGNYLESKKLPYFCSFSYSQQGVVVNGQRYPTTKMRWVEGETLKEYICHNCYSPSKLLTLASEFLDMCRTLHTNHIAHGDLQHGNIIVSPEGKLYLVDYDSLYVPTMGTSFKDNISGLADYQHPARRGNRYASYKLDYFSELVIYLSLIAIAEKPGLVRDYQIEDSESLLFKAADFRSFPGSAIYRELMGLSGTVQFYTLVLESYLYDTLIENLDPVTDYSMCKLRVTVLDKKRWTAIQNSRNKKDFADYVKRFPKGAHMQEAKTRIARIEEEERLQKEREERQKEYNAWSAAATANSLYALKKYLYLYPYGAHAKEARKRIDKIEHPTNYGKSIAGLLAGIALIVVIVLAVNYEPRPVSAPPATEQSVVSQGQQQEPAQSPKAAPAKKTNHSAEIKKIKQSLDSRLPGMEQAKREGLTPSGMSGAQKQINRLKELNDPSWRSYQSRLDKLK